MHNELFDFILVLQMTQEIIIMFLLIGPLSIKTVSINYHSRLLSLVSIRSLAVVTGLSATLE